MGYTRCINSVLLFELVLIREFAESFENQTSRVEIEGRLRRVFQYRVLGGCADFFVNGGTLCYASPHSFRRSRPVARSAVRCSLFRIECVALRLRTVGNQKARRLSLADRSSNTILSRWSCC